MIHATLMKVEGRIGLKPRNCPTCNKQNDSIEITQEQWDRYTAGAHIQDAFPELTDDQRETVMTGTCVPCWDALWGDSMDEEDE